MEIRIREATHEDLSAIRDLVLKSIASTCRREYRKEQIDVWLSAVENVDNRRFLSAGRYAIVAWFGEQVIGFANLENGHHIDFFYVDPDFQRRGVAGKLYKSLETEALRQNQKELSSDVSLTAVPFFESLGFVVKHKNTIQLQGIVLENYRMNKSL